MIVENTIRISAPVEDVWRHTVEVSEWPRWAPTIEHVQMLNSKILRLGSEVIVKLPMQPETLWRVVDFNEGCSFSWETSGKLLRMQASHCVKPSGDASICHLTLVIKGILGPVLSPFLRIPIAWALSRENIGLKTWCEQPVHTGVNIA